MQDIIGWIFLGLFITFVIAYIFLHKRNINLLKDEERNRMQGDLSQANSREFKYIWLIIAGFIGLIVLERLSVLPDFFISIVIFCAVVYGFFRNIWIYRKANLPQKFIKNELIFATIICSFFLIFNVLRLFENKQ